MYIPLSREEGGGEATTYIYNVVHIRLPVRMSRGGCIVYLPLSM